ncbi:hypothetical protein ACSBR1_017890 [Camellia fascicularis]
MEAHNIRTGATGPPSKLLDGLKIFILDLLILFMSYLYMEMKSQRDEKYPILSFVRNFLERFKIWSKNSRI